MSHFHGTTMSECRVDLWYNKQRVNQSNGKISLYLEICINGEKPGYVPIKGLKWHAVNFDWKKRALVARVKNDPDLLTFQAIIEAERDKYWKIIKRFILEERDFNLTDVFEAVNLFKSGHLFCAFMKQAIRDRQKTLVKKDMVKPSTADGHRTTLTWFLKFLKSDIDIMKIDGDLLAKFAVYLEGHMSEGSVWKRIQNIKSYISYAFRHKIMINHDHKRFNYPRPEPDPTWLEESDLKNLIKLYYGEYLYSYRDVMIPVELSEEQRRNLRAFLFACFTGLRISDLSRWNKNWIKNGHISFIPMKVRKSVKEPKPIIIPIIPIARQFIDDLSAESFQLPEDQVYNRGLKLLAEKVGITKPVTSHVARHTFATWLAIEGVSVLVISSLLGHKTTATTMVYIHIAEQFKGAEMMKIQSRFGLRPVPALELVK